MERDPALLAPVQSTLRVQVALDNIKACIEWLEVGTGRGSREVYPAFTYLQRS